MAEQIEKLVGAESPEQLKNREAIRFFSSVCSEFGYDAYVEKVHDSQSEIGIFFYSDSENLAKTKSPYESFINMFQISEHYSEEYTLTTETWRENIPYIKVSMIEKTA